MSTQLETMLLEEQALEQELEFLRNAEDITTAADKIFNYIQPKADVFCAPPSPDNEWWAQSKPKQGGCCNII